MSLDELVSRFKFTRVLDSSQQTKSVSLLGTIDSQNAILQLEKTHFPNDEDTVDEPSYLNSIESIQTTTQNDIYYWGLATLSSDITKNPSAKLNLTWPATDVHIRKYKQQKSYMIQETPELYQEIVKPYIQTMIGDRIRWVKNILHNGAEADRIIYNDPDPVSGFVLLPDMKWDGLNLDSLYLVAISRRDDINSLRDLNITHIDWLRQLSTTIKKHVVSVYNNKVRADELRLFIHYQPSYYHFHIHVVNILFAGLGTGIAVGHAILLDDVIEQLAYLGKEGFAKKTITYTIRESHDLWVNGLKKAHDAKLKEDGLYIDE